MEFFLLVLFTKSRFPFSSSSFSFSPFLNILQIVKKKKNMSKKSCKKFEEDIDCSEVLEDDNRSIIMGLIAQLRKGTDLSRVTLPTFVLEPRSMLEKITDFMSHPDLLVK